MLDAGTGIRNLPADLGSTAGHIHILLTHLHLDHIQGLLFFAPLFRPGVEVTLWGPAAPGLSLERRIARYLSAPLTPIEIRELPCRLDFRNCPHSQWSIGAAQITAAAVTHRGPTLGFRIEDAGRLSLLPCPTTSPRSWATSTQLGAGVGVGVGSLAREVDLLRPRLPVHGRRVPGPRGLGATPR